MRDTNLAALHFTPANPAATPPAWAGVAIDVDADGMSPAYSVLLLPSGGGPARTIVTTPDEAAARRVWCLLARVTTLPRFVAKSDGGYRALEQTVGPLVTRTAVARRGRRTPLRRRPMSRRTTPKPGAGGVHAGEREIICYE